MGGKLRVCLCALPHATRAHTGRACVLRAHTGQKPYSDLTWHAVLWGAVAPLPCYLATSCSLIWRSGAAPEELSPGIESVRWARERPGHAMFPALSVAATSGTFAFFAQAC